VEKYSTFGGSGRFCQILPPSLQASRFRISRARFRWKLLGVAEDEPKRKKADQAEESLLPGDSEKLAEMIELTNKLRKIFKEKNAKISKQSKIIKERKEEAKRMKRELKQLKKEAKKKTYFDISKYKSDAAAIFHWTGLKDYEQLRNLTEIVLEKLKKNNISLKLSNENAVAAVLIRLRRGFRYRTLAALFGLQYQTLQKIVDHLLPVISQIFEPSIRNLTDEEVKKWTNSNIFEEIPEKQTLIIDCTYIYCEHPENLSLQQDLFSLEIW